MRNTDQEAVSVSCREAGAYMGASLLLVTLQNRSMTVRITNLGATIMGIYTPDKNGVVKNVTAGFDQPEAYVNNAWYFGSTVGRYANRIGSGRFCLNGETVQLSVNNKGNHLHGGPEGFHRKIWNITALIDEPELSGVEMGYLSAHGEEGYPGNLQVKVKFLLNTQNELEISYSAVTDKSTPVNLTNHSYFNLSGFEVPVIKDHLLSVNAAAYTPKNEKNLPDGRILPVTGTPFDFSKPMPVGRYLHELEEDAGYDHNYVLQHGTSPAAMLEDPYSGRVLWVHTDQPGMQVYTANFWDGSITGQQHMPYVQYGAIALETQAFPDSPNQPAFPNTVLEPGQHFRSKTIYGFGVV